MLVDTDVLIWYLRGDESALRHLREQERISMSVVTYIELVQGMRDQKELYTLRNQVQEFSWPVLALTESVSHRAAFYVERHFLSHSLRLPDALIAATAVEHGLLLMTGNVRQYRVVDDLELVHFER